MGAFKVRIEAGDPRAERFEELQALGDTGATYTYTIVFRPWEWGPW
jgi:hypothetical protein